MTTKVHRNVARVAEPSPADELIQLRLRDTMDLVGVRVLDHLAIAGDEGVSFAEAGLI